ncbi:50S ribosomal protein L3 N(5)-glutamine methyltransferase [uncultured Alsobacter sp.]|uniref:50S ribosomal protein L3 N(5)-glutamine methyltransferase n=1 Tax=uncultured Alsobacter sp. TaxID=1748258 RepID=UPI0025EC6E11|nr:50S ribosomal protein L3 N(5)-glutamine methyltransferase [uncultured Alsobacter sp.]
MPTPAEAADVLLTVRDCLRYAVSRFNAAGLVYGHGTTNAFDEAAFVVLEGLNLPVDQLEPYLDARLLPAERLRLAELVEARVTTRKPAAYLLGRTYIQGIPFRVDERVIVPRSFLGELLLSDAFRHGDDTFVPDPAAIGSVLELCTGSGCLAIIAAMIFGQAEVDAVDLSPDALAVAGLNVEESGHADRIRLHQGDLYAPVAGRLYDLIITNPPYVDAEVMGMLPPEFRHEPAMALDGGEDGLDLVRRIVDGAAAHLMPGGGLLCEIGTGRERLEEAYPDLPFLWLDTADSEAEVFWITARDLGGA